MTVRIAVLGDPGQPAHLAALERARAQSVGAAADLEWHPLTLRDVPEEGFGGYDGVWYIDWPEVAEGEAARRAAWHAREAGVPFVLSPGAPEGWFVGQARGRTAYRTLLEHKQAEAAAIEASEREPRTYVHQMRGPRYRWWRPLAALAVAGIAYVFLSVVLLIPTFVPGVIESEADFLNPVNPVSSLLGNLSLAALIPATLLGLWVGFARSPWRVFSVAGRMRWGWLGWCVVVVLPTWLAYLAVTWFVFEQEVLDRPEHWVWLIVITLTTTPLQAAGEEVAFRGGLVQGLGAWFRSPVVALAVTTVVSTALFALAHTSLDPWVLIELGSLAVAGCWLSWRTGGLEAVIVLHVINNLLIMIGGALLGGLEESYVDTTTTGSPVSALMNVVATAIVTALLLWLARRRGIAPAGWRTPALG